MDGDRNWGNRPGPSHPGAFVACCFYSVSPIPSLPVISAAHILHLMSEVTNILSAIEQGEPHAAEKLLPLVYEELRRLAAQKLARETPGQTLQATALVHEAYLRLVDPNRAAHWGSRGHFFAAAAEAMQRILVENARRKQRIKHGGQFERVEIELADLPTRMPLDELLALDEALAQLRLHDPIKAKLVTLRYFGGMTIEQAAAVLGISRVTAFRYWTYARAWLYQKIRAERENG
jgi:RNA polymerase sigma factor (TIGR02999 family)